MWDALVLLCITAIFWGVTNPFLKRGGSGIEKVSGLIAKLRFIVCNWKCVAPLIVNQLGSILYFLALSMSDISVAVPVANSLTLTLTTITGYYLSEKFHKVQLLGCGFIVVGVVLCVLSKSKHVTD